VINIVTSSNMSCVSILGWDQSDKFVKIYITLKGVHSIPAENVEANFTERCGLALNIAEFWFVLSFLL